MSFPGIPLKLLHEAVGLTVTAELETGEIFRGKLSTVEDSMNMELEGVTHTDKKGRTREMPSAYVRGSLVTFFSLPPDLKLSPAAMSAAVEKMPERGRGKGFAGAGRGNGEKRARE
jgi:small nuclear ribonucleoprotein D3